MNNSLRYHASLIILLSLGYTIKASQQPWQDKHNQSDLDIRSLFQDKDFSEKPRHNALVTPDIARIVTFSYDLVLAPENASLEELHTKIQAHKEEYPLIVSAQLIIKSLIGVIHILKAHKETLPSGSNWDIILTTIGQRIEELKNPHKYKAYTTIGCPCGNCKFKA